MDINVQFSVKPDLGDFENKMQNANFPTYLYIIYNGYSQSLSE